MDVKLFLVRKGIRMIIYDYIDFKSFENLKSLNNKEFFRVNVRKVKMSVVKFSVEPLALKNAEDFSYNCCISLEPVVKDCIAFASRNTINIFNTVTNTNTQFKESNDSFSIYLICLVKTNFTENSTFSLFSLSPSESTLRVWAFNDHSVTINHERNYTELIQCVGTITLFSSNYWAMKIIEKGEYLDIIISGFSGISLYRGYSLKLVKGNLSDDLSKTYLNFNNTSKISDFEVIGDLIFCGDDRYNIHILDYTTFKVLKSIREKKYCDYHIRCLIDLSAYKSSYVAIASETEKNGLTLWNFLRTGEEVTCDFVEGYDFSDVLITIFYTRLKYKNYIIAGSGEDKSEVYVINLDTKEKVFQASLNSLWICCIVPYQDKQIVIVGNGGISLLNIQ